MRLDDLAGDGQAEAGMVAEALMLGAEGVEALEDALDIVGGQTGAIILDGDGNFLAAAKGGETNGAAPRREGEGVLHEVEQDLDRKSVV